MILKDNIATLSLLFWIFLRGTQGASFSNVFVQSKPVEYLKYNPAAASIVGPEIAQISSAPVEPFIQLEPVQGIVSPCVAPCVIPGTSIVAIPPQARANIIAYKSPIANVPVVYTNNDDATSYQYSYAVYDEHTGDQKSQSEQSDGSVVQGQYSLIEPNGSRREVTYTADDIKGFKAIVRNFSPKTMESTNDPDKSEKKDSTPPCNDVRSEQLKEEPKGEKSTEEKPKDEVETNNRNEEPSREETNNDVETTNVEMSKVEEITTEQPANENTKGETPELSQSNDVSYSDVIKCLQAKIRGANVDNQRRSNPSPLTYILLPTLASKPC